MTIPDRATFETNLAGGVVLWDVSHVLPTKTPRYRRRDVNGIVRQYHHHSGAMGSAGYRGAAGTARYAVYHRGWAGAPYHYWMSHVADRDPDGAIVVYRLQEDEVRCYHTGGAANTHGVGIAWQGNLTAREPSDDQIEAAEALIPWLIERHPMMGIDSVPISWHSESRQWGGSGKPTCPGPNVEAWLEAYRSAC